MRQLEDHFELVHLSAWHVGLDFLPELGAFFRRLADRSEAEGHHVLGDRVAFGSALDRLITLDIRLEGAALTGLAASRFPDPGIVRSWNGPRRQIRALLCIDLRRIDDLCALSALESVYGRPQVDLSDLDRILALDVLVAGRSLSCIRPPVAIGFSVSTRRWKFRPVIVTGRVDLCVLPACLTTAALRLRI